MAPRCSVSFLFIAIKGLLLLGFIDSAFALHRIFKHPEIQSEHFTEVRPYAVHLTEFIERGAIEEAERAALVNIEPFFSKESLWKANINPRTSYSGFLNVNKTCDSNMFFWFVPAKTQPESAPVTLWLQGGPGGSSLFGMFVENGPWIVDANMNLKDRDYDWSATHSMLYVDNPVGTGFSYTGSDGCYARNQDDVARDLYALLIQFFTIFKDFQPRDFYVSGESYAGKYVPAITHKIMQENQNAQIKINLKGMAIGDGLCDPVTMTNYGDYLFEVGMIGYKERTHFEEVAKNARENIRQGNWRIASELFDELLGGDLTGFPSYFKNVTGSDYYFNFLQFQEPKEFDYYSKFLNLPEVRKAIHVGDKVFHNGTKVETIMFEDMMKSVKPWVEDILNAGYKVLLFNGQLDIIVGYPLTENFVRSLRWQHSTEFKESPRKQWRIGTVTAGYVQEYQNLALVLVRNAGHMVPYDQPVLGFDLINRFTSNKPFGTNYRY